MQQLHAATLRAFKMTSGHQNAPELAETVSTINSDGWEEQWGDDENEYRMCCCPPRKYLAEPLHQEYGFCFCKDCKQSDLPDE